MNRSNVFRKYTDSETFERIVDYGSITEMWSASVSSAPNSVAVIDDGIEYTYAKLDDDVAHARALLKEHGLRPNDCVGLYIPNSYDFIKTYLAVTTIGCVAVLLPPHLDSMALLGCSIKFGLKALVYFPKLADKLNIVKTQNSQLLLISSADDSQNRVDAVPVSPNTLSTVLFTGGTTGKSKGARLSHRAIMLGTKNGCYGYRDVFGQRYLLVLPLTHVFGLIRNLLTAFYTRSSIFICRNNKDMFRDIAMYKPTILVLVPALAEMALNLSKQFGRNMLGADMKYIICGAAAVSPYLVKEYKALGISLFPGYGLTESANLVSGNPEADRKPDSVGYIYPGMEWRIVDGELWLKGDNMMDGYVGDADNELAYADGDWFKTGDLVRIDDEGFLYITGRIKEIIVLPSGENISPADIESKFYAMDTVQDCLVYDDNGSLTVEILPRATSIKANKIADVESHMKEITARINESLPSFARITRTVVRNTDFVRSPSMKIIRGQNGNVEK